jgi:hypothetical protein
MTSTIEILRAVLLRLVAMVRANSSHLNNSHGSLVEGPNK